jgi:hypothetical protein
LNYYYVWNAVMQRRTAELLNRTFYTPITKHFPMVEMLMRTAVGSGKTVVNILVFMGISVTCFAILGRQLYGGKFPATRRRNFDTITHTMLSLFSTITLDGWHEVLFDAMNCQGWGGTVARVFVRVGVVFLADLRLPLFVGVIIENFSVVITVDDSVEEEQLKAELE